MPYEIELSDEASETLQRLPIDIVVCISNHLERLAADPLGLSRRAAFPYRPVGQIYQFWCDDGFFITVFFHYLPGEQAIQVFAIGFTQYANGGRSDDDAGK